MTDELKCIGRKVDNLEDRFGKLETKVDNIEGKLDVILRFVQKKTVLDTLLGLKDSKGFWIWFTIISVLLILIFAGVSIIETINSLRGVVTVQGGL